MSKQLIVGDIVRVYAPGYHRMHGEVGVVVYVRSTIGVMFAGNHSPYGFTPDELKSTTKERSMSNVNLIAEARRNAPFSEDESLLMRLANALEESEAMLALAEDSAA